MSEQLGPVEVAVIAFPENRFTGNIVPAIADLVEGGIVSIVDLLFVSKDVDGTIVGLEIDQIDDTTAAEFDTLDGEVSGILSDEDIAFAAELLEPGSSAAIVVWENTWARRLVGALSEAGGTLIAHDRIDAATVAAALAAGPDTEE